VEHARKLSIYVERIRELSRFVLHVHKLSRSVEHLKKFSIEAQTAVAAQMQELPKLRDLTGCKWRH
jgi:hypothetical protein